jgi:hypothetical protein
VSTPPHHNSEHLASGPWREDARRVIGYWWVLLVAGIAWIAVAQVSPLWWLGLISGILMTALAFWTLGQFFIEKAYVLLVFAGIWALIDQL